MLLFFRLLSYLGGFRKQKQDAFPLLFWEKAARLEIPVTIKTGISGLLTRPVRAALAFCDWIEGDFPAFAPGGDEELSAGAAASTSAPLGRDRRSRH